MAAPNLLVNSGNVTWKPCSFFTAHLCAHTCWWEEEKVSGLFREEWMRFLEPLSQTRRAGKRQGSEKWEATEEGTERAVEWKWVLFSGTL